MSSGGKEPGERISYWLVPSEPDKARLQQIIHALADRFDAPRFEPHVTIYSGPHSPGDDASKILPAVRDISGITLHTTGIAHSKEFIKTVFLNFAPDERLTQLSHELKGRSSTPADYELKPHLSLLYAQLPFETKAALARELTGPPSIRFGAVQAVVTKAKTRTRSDVESWRVVAEHKLGSA